MEPYLEFAKKLALEAGEIALHYFGFETESTRKEDNTPLTVADTEINDLVIKRISAAYPNHSIYGEESSEIKEGSEYIRVCDPIDGTMAFSCGIPSFVFSLALVDQSNGQPVLGVIYDPIMKNMYWAHKGSGAYRNDKKISVSQDTSLKNTYLNTGSTGKSLGFSVLPLIQALRER